MQPGYVREDQLDAAFLASIDPRVLSLTLFITEKCNFRCSYCYETFERPTMSAELISAIVKLLANRSDGLQHLSINWFGGEPLLNWRSILSFYEQLKTVEDRSSFVRQDSMTTNGFLLDRAMAGRILGCGIRTFQITLDGPPQFHDVTRTAQGGKPTFERIYKNLQSLSSLDADFQIALRIHINRNNYKQLPSFVESLDHDFGNDSRFGLHLVPVEKYNSGASSLFDQYASREQIKLAFQESLANVRRLKSLNVPAGSCYVCYASKANSLVIRSDGKLLKCTVAVDDDRNQIGTLNSDGTLSIDQDKFRWWIRGYEVKDKKRLACPNSFPS